MFHQAAQAISQNKIFLEVLNHQTGECTFCIRNCSFSTGCELCGGLYTVDISWEDFDWALGHRDFLKKRNGWNINCLALGMHTIDFSLTIHFDF